MTVTNNWSHFLRSLDLTWKQTPCQLLFHKMASFYCFGTFCFILLIFIYLPNLLLFLKPLFHAKLNLNLNLVDVPVAKGPDGVEEMWE